MASTSPYEEEAAFHLYMLFHYGSDQDQLPFSFGPQNSRNFPVRCVTECLDLKALPSNASALDLGCAVGRSTFELARHCKRVVGVDNSRRFIDAAQQLYTSGTLEYFVAEEGMKRSVRKAERPKDLSKDSVKFRCCDAMDLLQEPSKYDVILAANLICRLPDPITFLKELPNLLEKNGQLILTSPYSWLEEYTNKALWLQSTEGENPLDAIKTLFGKRMVLQRAFNMPFLIREHLRKYQWGVAETSLWRFV